MDGDSSIYGPRICAFLGMLVVGLSAAWFGTSAAATLASPPSTPYAGTYVTELPVNAFEQYGDTTYIGGSFSTIGPRVGHGALVSRSTGQVVASSLDVAGGDIETSEADGSGGLFIGGSFTSVGGVTQKRLAHINANGSLDLTWNPDPNGDGGTVYALALDGSTLYVGGQFTNISGQMRNRIAALDAVTGTASTWDPNANGNVYALAIRDTFVIVGGEFTNIGGLGRRRIALLRQTTGQSVPTWDPNSDGTVETLAYVFDSATSSYRLFVGGTFSTIGAMPRSNIAELNTTGAADSWNPNVDNRVRDIDVYGSTAYVVGDFDTVKGGANARSKLAAFDTTAGTDGSVTGWNPGASNPVHAVAVSPSGSTVYVGGDFSTVAGQTRNMLAEIDTTTGSVTSWSPMANNSVRTLNISSSYVFAGGLFTSVGVVLRKGLAAIDSGGVVTSWNPWVVGDGVSALDISADGSTIYAGGQFYQVNDTGLPRNNLAAFSTATGAATSWNPGADARVSALEIIGSNAYIGGQFLTAGGQPRSGLAAINLTNATATSWDPNANGKVSTLEPTAEGSSIYAGGGFTSINGGTARNRVAEISLNNGTATSWNPNALDASDPSAPVDVNDISASGSSVYIGGSFTRIGSQDRNRLAEVSSTTGLATSWNPNLNNTVRGVATDGSSVFAAGDFSAVNGGAINRSSLAGFSIADGSATSWDPNTDFRGETIEVIGATVYAGGRFTTVSNYSHSSLAQFTAAPTNTQAPVVSGTGLVGDSLSCSSGNWNDGNAAIAYQWLRDGAQISGETTETYTTVDTDIGTSISCQVTATNVGGNTTVTSNAITVTSAPDNPPSNPTTPATDSDMFSPQITGLKVSPTCQQLYGSSRSRKTALGHRGRGSRAKADISYTLSEDATVTLSIKVKKASGGLYRRCSKLNRRQRAKAKVPGKYSEVERVTKSQVAGDNSTSIGKSSASRPSSLAGVALPSFYNSDGSYDRKTSHPNVPDALEAPSWDVLDRKGSKKSREKQTGIATVATTSNKNNLGVNTVRISSRLLGKKLGKGSYKVYIRAVDASGNVSSTETAKFYILSS